MRVTSLPLFAAFALGVPVLVGVTIAGYARADDAPGRYTMTPAEGGALKLDTVTGTTWFCTRAGTEWGCTPTKDGDKALRAEIDGLKGEIVVLKEQLVKMEELAGLGDPGKNGSPGAGRSGGDQSLKGQLPTEQEVDQAFDYVERMMKKLKERLGKLERDTKPGTPAPL